MGSSLDSLEHVIIILPASPGLSVYYEGILNKLDNTDDEPFVDDFEDEEIYEELLDELETESKYIH